MNESTRGEVRRNSPGQILFASLIGTTIEFFDFYVYATAAVLVFPTLFFPTSDPTSALLQSFATFSIGFFARPVGAMVFGHFGDVIGRKATLVAALIVWLNERYGMRGLQKARQRVESLNTEASNS